MVSLIDANVLIRAHDPVPSPYSEAAVKMLKRLAEDGTGVVSAQSLAEFAYYAIHAQKLDTRLVWGQLDRLAAVYPVLPITGAVVTRAVQAMRKHPIGYYDAQVWALARLNGVGQVVTEGLWHKVTRDKVRYFDLLRQAPTLGWDPEDWGPGQWDLKERDPGKWDPEQRDPDE